MLDFLTSRRRLLGLGGLFMGVGLIPRAVQAKSIRLNGWFRVDQLQGQVSYRRTAQAAPLKAWLGQTIWQVGEIFETGPNGKAFLTLDSSLGTMTVERNTRWMVKALHRNRAGGRVTQIYLLRGQVYLKVRSMINPSSRLEIQTPAGITGVRGTEFGVAVQPSGQTGVATLAGQVDVAALGETVALGQKLQTLIVPQFPPQPPQVLRDDPDLKMASAQWSEREIRLVGVTDPVNVLFVDGTSFDTGSTGSFEILYPLTGQETVITLLSVTPLGNRRKYEIPVS